MSSPPPPIPKEASLDCLSGLRCPPEEDKEAWNVRVCQNQQRFYEWARRTVLTDDKVWVLFLDNQPEPAQRGATMEEAVRGQRGPGFVANAATEAYEGPVPMMSVWMPQQFAEETASLLQQMEENGNELKARCILQVQYCISLENQTEWWCDVRDACEDLATEQEMAVSRDDDAVELDQSLPRQPAASDQGRDPGPQTQPAETPDTLRIVAQP